AESETREASPVVIGTTPVYDADGRVRSTTWTSLADAKAEALRSGLELVVLVNVDEATRARVSRASDPARSIVAVASPTEAPRFGAGAGVYRYTLQGGRLLGGKESSRSAAPAASWIVAPGGCANGRCGR
ncbi:MAG TPA: hypothetical protein VGE52_01505, partial [Pirellulales bacterium]